MRKLGLKYFSCPVNCIAGRIMKISQNIALVTSKIAIYFFIFKLYIWPLFWSYLCLSLHWEKISTGHTTQERGNSNKLFFLYLELSTTGGIQRKKGVTQVTTGKDASFVESIFVAQWTMFEVALWKLVKILLMQL